MTPSEIKSLTDAKQFIDENPGRKYLFLAHQQWIQVYNEAALEAEKNNEPRVSITYKGTRMRPAGYLERYIRKQGP